MQTSTSAVPLAPETLLAIEAGIRNALKEFVPDDKELKKKASSDHQIGPLRINMVLEFDSVTIGHDTDKAPTASIPVLPALALLAKRLGKDRTEVLTVLRDCIEKALKLDENATKILLKEEGVEEMVDEIKKKVIGTLPRTPVSKSVTAKGARLSVTRIEQKV